MDEIVKAYLESREAYDSAVEAARQKWAEARTAARDEYYATPGSSYAPQPCSCASCMTDRADRDPGETGDAARQAMYDKISAARVEYNRAESEAAKARKPWEYLLESTDPLVRFIGERCDGYQEQAVVILEALPATTERLEAIAAEYDWCSVWDEFYEQALGAGVLTVPGSPELARLQRYLRRNDDYALELLDKYLAAAERKAAEVSK